MASHEAGRIEQGTQAAPGRTARMFAIFYTGVIGAGALAALLARALARSCCAKVAK